MKWMIIYLLYKVYQTVINIWNEVWNSPLTINVGIQNKLYQHITLYQLNIIYHSRLYRLYGYSSWFSQK